MLPTIPYNVFYWLFRFLISTIFSRTCTGNDAKFQEAFPNYHSISLKETTRLLGILVSKALSRLVFLSLDMTRVYSILS
ncbi:MAG: hypothetical protein ACTSWN_04405 [Promethearchaeota archaeon]